MQFEPPALQIHSLSVRRQKMLDLFDLIFKWIILSLSRRSSHRLLTAICKSFRMALLLPVPQYAMANVYIPERRKTGSLSVDKLVTNGSASSNRAYIVNAMPTANPRSIFSCCVSCAYCKNRKRKINANNFQNWCTLILILYLNV